MLDVETAPAVAYVWRLFKEDIPIDRLITPGRIICWSAKWYKKKGTFFGAEWEDPTFMAGLHNLLSEADAVITYNGGRFDMPKILGEFVRGGLPPVAPIPNIDLYKTVRGLGYDSGKLAYIAPMFGVGKKVKHEGFSLWKKVLEGDVKAQKRMESYNRRDTELLQGVYDKLRPYIKNHPHVGSGARPECPTCGSAHVQRRGVRRTRLYFVERLHCQGCGGWSDGKRAKVNTIGKE